MFNNPKIAVNHLNVSFCTVIITYTVDCKEELNQTLIE